MKFLEIQAEVKSKGMVGIKVMKGSQGDCTGPRLLKNSLCRISLSSGNVDPGATRFEIYFQGDLLFKNLRLKRSTFNMWCLLAYLGCLGLYVGSGLA